MSFDDPLLQSVLDLLDGGPRTLEEIVQSLGRSGYISDENDDELEELFFVIDSSDIFWETADGLHCRTDQILDGVYLTHQLSQREIDSGLVDISPDLEGLYLRMEEITLEG